jgi:hypothetical protein
MQVAVDLTCRLVEQSLIAKVAVLVRWWRKPLMGAPPQVPAGSHHPRDHVRDTGA